MINEFIKNSDQLIRSGRIIEARKSVRTLLESHSKGPSRYSLVPIAALCRRTGLFSLSLRLLHAIVRPGPREIANSSPLERAEYAGSLLQLGAIKEAIQILSTVPQSEVPQASLFFAFAYFAEWNYTAAIPVLRRYISNPHLTDYERLIGEVNLAAAYVIEQTTEPQKDPLLYRLLETTRNQGNDLLYGNILEISAQDAVYRGDLSHAAALLNQVPLSTNLMAKKWRAITQLLNGDREAGSKALLRVRRQAEIARQWETLRECDLFLGSVFEDQALLAKVYFMTPFACYRSRIEQISKRQFTESDHRIKLGDGIQQLELDLSQPNRLALKPGSLPARLLLALFEDGYKPQTIPALHGKLFPQNHFNPHSSPQQVHQTIKRLRRKIREHSLSVVEDRGTYRLNVRRNVTFKIRPFVPAAPVDVREAIMIQALERSGKKELKSQEAAAIWEVSIRTANRALLQLCSIGQITKIGSGKRTYFLLTGKKSY